MNHHDHTLPQTEPAVAEVALRFCYSGTELADVESFLAAQPGVRDAAIDRTRSVVDVAYDPAVTGYERLEAVMRQHGFGCECHDNPASHTQPPCGGLP